MVDSANTIFVICIKIVHLLEKRYFLFKSFEVLYQNRGIHRTGDSEERRQKLKSSCRRLGLDSARDEDQT